VYVPASYVAPWLSVSLLLLLLLRGGVEEGHRKDTIKNVKALTMAAAKSGNPSSALR
jgi:hypothetical protein